MDLLNKQTTNDKEDLLVLNITYHPAFSKLKNIVSNIHLLLTPDKEHQKVFQNLPILGFKKGKSLKDFLVRAKVPPLRIQKGSCAPCKKSRCQVCKHVTTTSCFSTKSKTKTYNIRPENLNCSSKKVVYLIECKTCHALYVGSTEQSLGTDLIIINVFIGIIRKT